jgi:hypothetical protein
MLFFITQEVGSPCYYDVACELMLWTGSCDDLWTLLAYLQETSSLKTATLMLSLATLSPGTAALSHGHHISHHAQTLTLHLHARSRHQTAHTTSMVALQSLSRGISHLPTPLL